jgi:hypothetical protein
MKPGKRKVLDKTTALGGLKEQLEKVKDSVRAKVEHPFWVIKRQFGHVTLRYRGLAKNTAQLKTRVSRPVEPVELYAGWEPLFQIPLGTVLCDTKSTLKCESESQSYNIIISD